MKTNIQNKKQFIGMLLKMIDVDLKILIKDYPNDWVLEWTLIKATDLKNAINDLYDLYSKEK